MRLRPGAALAKTKKCVALLRDQSGQAMVEYTTITTVFLTGLIVAGATWPYTSQLFAALQLYIDAYFFGLNVSFI